jgi:hypothetical protein
MVNSYLIDTLDTFFWLSKLKYIVKSYGLAGGISIMDIICIFVIMQIFSK